MSPAAPAPSAAPARGGEEPKKEGLIDRLNEEVTELADIIDNKETGLKVLLAETMFLLDGRKRATSVVLTPADAKPSLLFNTYEKVLQLKDEHGKLFFSPATEFAGEKLALVKKWACAPWETNLAHAPWLMPLNDDSALSVQEMVVKFFPEAMSLSSMMIEEAEMDHTLIAGNNHCETWPIPSRS